MGSARLRATHQCRILTQWRRLGGSRFSYFVFRFLCLGRSVELALLFTGRYISCGEARFRIPHGCKCDLLFVLGLEKPVFAIVPIEAQRMVASARSCEATLIVCLFSKL